MAAQTNGLVRARKPGARWAYPVLANAVLYRGGLAALDSNGRIKAGATATGLVAAGVVEVNTGLKGATNTKGTEVWDATGLANGAFSVEVVEGIFRFENSGGGDTIAATNVGAPCYIVDDQTVALTSNSGARSIAGRIHGVDSDGVWVVVGLHLSRALIIEDQLSTGNAYTQTYSTADRTVANPTGVAIGATLTDSTGLSGSHDDTLAATTVPAALTDNSGGAAADGTIGAVTAPTALTDSTGGTPSGTLAAITGGGANCENATKNAVASLAARQAEDRTAVIALTDAVTELATKTNAVLTLLGVMAQNASDTGQKVIELVTQVNALVVDDLDNRRTITALIDDLQAADIVD